MAYTPHDDSRGVDARERLREEHGVVVVFGLLEGVNGIAWRARGRASAAVVVEYSGEAGGLEGCGSVREIVLFEEGELGEGLSLRCF